MAAADHSDYATVTSTVTVTVTVTVTGTGKVIVTFNVLVSGTSYILSNPVVITIAIAFVTAIVVVTIFAIANAIFLHFPQPTTLPLLIPFPEGAVFSVILGGGQQYFAQISGQASASRA